MNTFTLFLVIIVLICICGILSFLLTNKGDKKYTEQELNKIIEQELNKSNQQKNNKFLEKTELDIQKKRLESQQKIQEEEKQFVSYKIEAEQRLTRKELLIEEKERTIKEDQDLIVKDKQQLEKVKIDLRNQTESLNDKQRQVSIELFTKLESLSGFSREQAKNELINKVKTEIGHEIVSLQHKIVDDAQDNANIEARNIVSLAIQRCSSDVANEMTVTVIKLNGEEDKGKLIGKGGRNIQWLEKTLGVELIIDDTPEIVTISGFSGIRRHIAKRTIEKLLEDGRVHPSAIEEMYEKAKSEIAIAIQTAGEEAVAELGIIDFPPKLIRILGRLKFRTSYGQNMLKHSVEMAKLAGLLVDELNSTFKTKVLIDREICVKGALLHDVGKAVDEEQMPKGNHIELGEKICDMFGLDWKIKKCISSHHLTGGDYQSYQDENNGFCVEACIVDSCDNISGSRPGARKETAEAYYQRMEALERIANSVVGVQKSFIMRGSRELWVFFDPSTQDLAQVSDATRQIVNSINSSIKSPFKIQVNAFLENRLVEYAG